LDFSGTLWVKEEEEFSDWSDHVERVKWLSEIFKLGESWHQLKNVVLKIFLFKVAEAITVVKTDLDSGLEQIDLTHHIVEEGHNFNTAELVPFKF